MCRSTTARAQAQGNKVAKTQLALQVASKTDLAKKQVDEAVSAQVDVTVEAPRAGKTVGLPGLGTLSIKTTAARTGVKPGASEKIQIPADKKVAFKVAGTLKTPFIDLGIN